MLYAIVGFLQGSVQEIFYFPLLKTVFEVKSGSPLSEGVGLKPFYMIDDRYRAQNCFCATFPFSQRYMVRLQKCGPSPRKVL